MANKSPTSKWEAVDKTGMMLDGYVKTNNTIIRKILSDYNPSTAVVYIVILSHKNEHDGYSWPKVETIQRETGLGRGTVKRALNDLVEGGYLFISSGDSMHSNRYYFPKESFFNPVEITGLKRKTQSSTSSSKKRDTIPTSQAKVLDTPKESNDENDEGGLPNFDF